MPRVGVDVYVCVNKEGGGQYLAHWNAKELVGWGGGDTEREKEL